MHDEDSVLVLGKRRIHGSRASTGVMLRIPMYTDSVAALLHNICASLTEKRKDFLHSSAPSFASVLRFRPSGLFFESFLRL